MPRVKISVALAFLCLTLGGCGDEPLPDAESRTSSSASADPFAQLFRDDATPLVRTDFSDDAAWERVVQAVTAPDDFGDVADPEDGGSENRSYAPNVKAVDDPAFDGATVQSLVDAGHGKPLGYLLVADDRSMREAVSGGEVTVVYVDLSVLPEDAEEFGFVYGRGFRCEVGQVASIEVNLSIANMDFDEFADSIDTDGVFRGFPE